MLCHTLTISPNATQIKKVGGNPHFTTQKTPIVNKQDFEQAIARITRWQLLIDSEEKRIADYFQNQHHEEVY